MRCYRIPGVKMNIAVFGLVSILIWNQYRLLTVEDLCEWGIPDFSNAGFNDDANSTLDTQNAAIVYLGDFGSASKIYSLEKSLESLHYNFLQWNDRYPVFVFYESSHRNFLTADVRSRLEAATKTLLAKTSSPLLSFHEIIGFDEIPPYVKDIPATFADRGIGYRFMCRFWAYGFFNQPAASSLRYYWRLDTDLFLRRSIRIDPFQRMEARNMMYFHGVSAFESPAVVIGLWDTALEYMRARHIHPNKMVLLSKLVALTNHHEQAILSEDRSGVERVQSMPLDDAIDLLKSAGYNNFIYYNNFELSRVDIWRSPEYLDFFFFLDRAGGIFTHRWGDAPIRTLALAVLHDSLGNWSSVEQWGGLCYEHQGYRGTLQ